MVSRFRLQPLESPPPSSGRLGDWYANLLSVGSSRFVLCLNERSLLPVLLPARKEAFPFQFPESLAAVLHALELPPEGVDEEVAAARDVAFAKPLSRSVLGALDDFAFHAWHDLADPHQPRTPLDTALRLAGMPSKPIGYDSPERVARSIFQTLGPS